MTYLKVTLKNSLQLAAGTVVAGALLAGCSTGSNSTGPTTTSTPEPLTYKVLGENTRNNEKVYKASVTYTTATGTQQETLFDEKWSKSVPGITRGSVTAQKDHADYTGITCEIWRGDVRVASNTSWGDYAVVSCAG